MIPEFIRGLFQRQESSLPESIQKVAIPKNFTDLVIEHEDLVPFQTPFRITSDGMGKWVSMFDDTLTVQLDPAFNKPEDRKNFLFLKNQDDLSPAVEEQFRRYAERNPGISITDAIRIFDQTGADGKIDFLKKRGINTDAQLSSVINMNR